MTAPTHAEIAERNGVMQRFYTGGWTVKKLCGVFRLSKRYVESIVYGAEANPMRQQSAQTLQKVA